MIQLGTDPFCTWGLTYFALFFIFAVVDYKYLRYV